MIKISALAGSDFVKKEKKRGRFVIDDNCIHSLFHGGGIQCLGNLKEMLRG